MRLVLNQFNPFVGKYQTPVTVDYKRKYGGWWFLRVTFPSGSYCWIDVYTLERDAMRKINLRKIKTKKWW